MRKLISLLFVAALLPLLVLTSCRKDEDPAVKTELEVLTDYIKDNSLDLSNILDGWVTSGAGINTNQTDYSVPDYYVLDFRSAIDFDAGHIKGAHNVTLATMLAEAENAGALPILSVCYTGQTAARATGLLRMSGFTAKSLKWGMCGWHADFQGKWNTNAAQLNDANWKTTGTPETATEFDVPTLSTGKTSGADILNDRILAAIGNSTWSVSKTDVLANPAAYFINNKWSETHWTAFGHIDGAYRIDVGDGLGIDGITYMNPSADTVVTYCYTGQTSSILTSWLNVVGYDNAKSLLFGATGIIWDDLRVGANADAISKKSTWQGDGSSWDNNFGYYKTDGTYIAPSK